MSAGEVDLLTAMIAEGALALVLFYSLLGRRKISIGRRSADVLLVLLSAASIFAYIDFGHFRMGPRGNPHDFFHYYMGAKYSREVGYTNLYRSVLVADMEGNQVYKPNSSIRNLDDYHYESVARVLRRAGEYKALFDEARWDEFCMDVEYFQSLMYGSRWNQLLKDKGYNATPVWNTVGRFLTSRAPTDSNLGMALLLALDPALLVVMLLFVARAFGWRAALFALIFHATNFMMNFVHIKTSFLRLDWVTLMVISVCLLKLRHYKSAGTALAYSVAARIFPLIFAFGLGVRFVSHLIRTRTVHRGHLGFFVLFLLVSLVLVGAATLDNGGVGPWKDFYDKVSMHNSDIAGKRVGFKYVFLMPYGRDHEPWSTFAADARKTLEDHRVLWWTILGAVLIVSAYVARNLDDYEAVAFGAVPAFFLVAPTFYYYVYLVVPLFLFLPKIAQLDRALGLVGMFALSIVAFILGRLFPLDLSLNFLLSCMVLALVLYMVMVGLRCDPRLRHGVATLGRSVRARPGRWAAIAVGLAMLASSPWAAKALLAPSSDGVEGGASSDVQIVLVGDVMLARNAPSPLERTNLNYSFPFEEVATYLRAADVAFCNLECPISARGEQIEKRSTFNAPPEAAAGLRFAGFDVISLANNHILDFGTEAMVDTVEYLDAVRIQSCGLTERGDRQTPVILDVDGVRIAFLAYCDPQTPEACASEFDRFPTGPARADDATMAGDLESLGDHADIIVVSLHWGIEGRTEHSPRQQELGRWLIDRGVAIVAGHHPRVLQEPERYKDGVIIYSMGNFVTDPYGGEPAQSSRLYRIGVASDGIRSVTYLPVEITREGQPVPTSERFTSVDKGSSP